jgi:Uma2 family endonuclease
MNVAVQRPWTIDRFLDWVVLQEEPYEFDGIRPVPTNGGTANHSQIISNLLVVLQARLRKPPFWCFAPGYGVQAGASLRFPDALITGSRQQGKSRLATDVQAVFEVLSPSNAATDRITKVGEYASVPSIQQYVIINSERVEALDHRRGDRSGSWVVTAVGAADRLSLPGMGIEFPLAMLYEDVDLSGAVSA